MLSRSTAEWRIQLALRRAGATVQQAEREAARLVDEIYGVLGA